MSTSQTTPNGETAPDQILVTKEVFDLSKGTDVLVAKRGNFVPVQNMDDFVQRMGSDADAILKIVNSGLRSHEESKLAEDKSAQWELVTEDDEGNTKYEPVPADFAPISPKKSVELKKAVLTFAKMFFGYERTMVKGDSKEVEEQNRKKKAEAKDEALKMIMSNPAAVEKLKGE